MSSSFHLLSTGTLKKARTYLRTAAAAEDFESIHTHFLETLPALLPTDYHSMDVWSADRLQLLHLISTSEIARAVTPLADTISSTIASHPVVAAAGWVTGEHSPALLSAYVSQREMRELPIYQDVYRHFNVEFQMVADFGALSDRNFTVTLNRGNCDFSTEEFQLFDLISTGMDRIVHGIDHKQRTRSRLSAIAKELTVSSGLNGWLNLTAREVETLGLLPRCRHLSDIAVAQGVSRYTVTERMTSIRDKLGLETTAQLRAVIRDLMTPP